MRGCSVRSNPFYAGATRSMGKATRLTMDDALQVNDGVAIPLTEIELRASRSSGPGGQHANVTASRIEAVFDVDASEALSDSQRDRLRERLGARVTAVAQDARS